MVLEQKAFSALFGGRAMKGPFVRFLSLRVLHVNFIYKFTKKMSLSFG